MSNTPQQSYSDAVNVPDGRTLDDVYDALADERRRHAVAVLAETRPPVDGGTLARSVAAAEVDAAPDEVSDHRTERVHAKLYHVHLPKLDDVGLVEYDSEADTIHDVADGLGDLPY